jgi:hypothetical protein
MKLISTKRRIRYETIMIETNYIRMKKIFLGMISLMIAVNFANAKPVDHDPDDPMRSKTFSKSFAMDTRDKVSLNNRYGDILIKTWDKREVRVDVAIKVYSKDEQDAQRLLDETVIEAGKSGDQVSFKTSIGMRGGEYGSKVKNGKTIWRREVKVNYVVYMPASNGLILSNQYGNVSMGNFYGAVNAKVQYGNFTAGNLNSTDNYLDMQYGKTTVQEINKAVIKHQYGSGLVLGTVGTLDLKAQYVAVTIGTIKGNALIKQQYGQGLNIAAVDNLDLEAQYVNVKIGNVNGNANIKQQYNNISIASVNNKLNLKGQYANVKVGNLRGDGNFIVEYNKVTIENISTGCKRLIIGAAYSHVSLGFSNDYQADFDVKVSYSGFNYGSGVASKLVSDKGNTKIYNGKIGNGGSAMVSINDDYGSVTFK